MSDGRPTSALTCDDTKTTSHCTHASASESPDNAPTNANALSLRALIVRSIDTMMSTPSTERNLYETRNNLRCLINCINPTACEAFEVSFDALAISTFNVKCRRLFEATVELAYSSKDASSQRLRECAPKFPCASTMDHIANEASKYASLQPCDARSKLCVSLDALVHALTSQWKTECIHILSKSWGSIMTLSKLCNPNCPSSVDEVNGVATTMNIIYSLFDGEIDEIEQLRLVDPLVNVALDSLRVCIYGGQYLVVNTGPCRLSPMVRRSLLVEWKQQHGAALYEACMRCMHRHPAQSAISNDRDQEDARYTCEIDRVRIQLDAAVCGTPWSQIMQQAAVPTSTSYDMERKNGPCLHQRLSTEATRCAHPWATRAPSFCKLLAAKICLAAVQSSNDSMWSLDAQIVRLLLKRAVMTANIEHILSCNDAPLLANNDLLRQTDCEQHQPQHRIYETGSSSSTRSQRSLSQELRSTLTVSVLELIGLTIDTDATTAQTISVSQLCDRYYQQNNGGTVSLRAMQQIVSKIFADVVSQCTVPPDETIAFVNTASTRKRSHEALEGARWTDLRNIGTHIRLSPNGARVLARSIALQLMATTGIRVDFQKCWEPPEDSHQHNNVSL